MTTNTASDSGAAAPEAAAAAGPGDGDGPGDGAAMLPFPAKRLAAAWGRLMEEMSRRPELWLSAAQAAHRRQLQALAALGQDPQNVVVAPAPGDRRFNHPAWRDSPFHAFLMQSYLVNSDLLRQALRDAALPEDDRKLLQFVMNQQIDALSPANFPAANPEVLRAAVASGGQSLVQGAQNFARDLQAQTVQNTDTAAFQVGKNLAVTPGKVVMQNELVQLIQYAPPAGAKQVRAKPLLVVPPCINKFYILDLQPANSLVGHLVQAGFSVFLVSWVNAAPAHRDKTWDDYLRLGVMDPLEAARAIGGAGGGGGVNAMGFCVGGTLLACAQAVLAAEGKRGADSLTLLTTLLDFADAGEIGLFIDEEVVGEYEARYENGGLLDGRDLARGFAALRPNDLVWPYVIGNYFKGEKPPAFDLLFWNADSTNLPGPMFAEYLRQTYLENRLTRGGKDAPEMCGAPVDLKALTLPTFVVASERDHIVPWRSAYAGARLLGGTPQFTLASSGHIAGIVNPPAANKGWRMSAAAGPLPADPEEWKAAAKKKTGGWWPDWHAWLAKRSGKLVAAPTKFGDARHPPLEDAPGSYVTAERPEIPAGEAGRTGGAGAANWPGTANWMEALNNMTGAGLGAMGGMGGGQGFPFNFNPPFGAPSGGPKP